MRPFREHIEILRYGIGGSQAICLTAGALTASTSAYMTYMGFSGLTKLVHQTGDGDLARTVVAFGFAYVLANMAKDIFPFAAKDIFDNYKVNKAIDTSIREMRLRQNTQSPSP